MIAWSFYDNNSLKRTQTPSHIHALSLPVTNFPSPPFFSMCMIKLFPFLPFFSFIHSFSLSLCLSLSSFLECKGSHGAQNAYRELDGLHLIQRVTTLQSYVDLNRWDEGEGINLVDCMWKCVLEGKRGRGRERHCESVCVCEREGKREREREREREALRKCVCVIVCVCVRERERERGSTFS